jgi:glycine cleavage system protein P-like pyridoxal-binding family
MNIESMSDTARAALSRPTIPTVYELSAPGRCAVDLPDADVPRARLPEARLRRHCGLPELSQLDVVRHYLALSQRNFGVDMGFYPLGSCTMKYNPKVNEEIARLPGFAESHPLQDAETVQGNLALMFDLQEWLAARLPPPWRGSPPSSFLPTGAGTSTWRRLRPAATKGWPES